MKKIALLLLSCLLIFTAGCANAAQPGSSLTASPGTSSADSGESSNSQESGVSSPSSSADSQNGSAAASSKKGTAQPSSVQTSPSKTAPSSPASSETATVTVTIPEGYTLARIAAKMDAAGVCKKADFIKSAQTYDFSYYPLVKSAPSGGRRAYKLEGYLYPDTYILNKNMKPQDVIGKFLRNAGQRISGRYGYSGMSTDQVVTLASIIEKEADDSSDMKMVSSVFHNRLNKGMRLQADSTIVYCTGCLLSPNGPFSDSYKYYYNTYRCAALPAGPICNPGATALSAAANPASTQYYYFFTKAGKYYYQKTLDEHKAKLKELGMSDDSVS